MKREIKISNDTVRDDVILELSKIYGCSFYKLYNFASVNPVLSTLIEELVNVKFNLLLKAEAILEDIKNE